MKIITKTQDALTTGASQVAQAVQESIATLSSELDGGLSEGRATITEIGQKLLEIPPRLARLPGMLNPSDALQDLGTTLQSLQGDLQKIAASGAQLGERLKPILESFADTRKDVDTLIASVRALPGRLAQLAPPSLSGLQAQAQGIIDGGQRMLTQASGITGRLQSLATSPPNLLPAAGQLAHGEIELARSGIIDTQAQLIAGLGQIGTAFSQLHAVPLASCDEITDSVQQGLQHLLDRVGALAGALANELGTLQTQLDGFHQRIDELSASVGKPLEQARGTIEALATEVDAIGTEVSAVIDALNAQVERIERMVETVKNAINQSVDGVDTALGGFRDALNELSAEIEALIPRLRALPDLLQPVNEQIDAAEALITEIQERIDVFVVQADQTLAQASVELDQAEERCDNAITVCTRYMMRAPPLIAARLLFVGVKATLPGIRATIVTARSTVKTAGQTARKLLDQALTAVGALRGLLEQALTEVRARIEQLVALLVKQQEVLAKAAAKLDEISLTLRQQAEAIGAKLDSVSTAVRNTVDDCLAQTQPKEAVDRAASTVRGLNAKLIDPLQARIDDGTARTHGLLDELRAGLDTPAQALQDGMVRLRDSLAPLQDAIDQPRLRLRETVEGLQAKLDGALQEGIQTLQQAGNQALGLLQQGDDAVDHLLAHGMAAQDAVSTNVATANQVLQRISAESQAARQLLSSAPMARTVLASCASLLQTALTQPASPLEAQCSAASAANQAAAGPAGQLEAAQADNQTRADTHALELPDGPTLHQQADSELGPARSNAAASAQTSEERTAAQQQQLAGVDAPWETLPEESKAAFQAAEDGAAETRDELQSSVADLAASADAVGDASTSAENELATHCDQCQAEVTALRDQAQAGLDAAKAEVDNVKAQTETARADLRKAEAIVAAEVAKHGGQAAIAAAGIGESPQAGGTATGESAAQGGADSANAGQPSGSSQAKGPAGTRDTAAQKSTQQEGAAPTETDSASTAANAQPDDAETRQTASGENAAQPEGAATSAKEPTAAVKEPLDKNTADESASRHPSGAMPSGADDAASEPGEDIPAGTARPDSLDDIQATAAAAPDAALEGTRPKKAPRQAIDEEITPDKLRSAVPPLAPEFADTPSPAAAARPQGDTSRQKPRTGHPIPPAPTADGADLKPPTSGTRPEPPELAKARKPNWPPPLPQSWRPKQSHWKSTSKKAPRGGKKRPQAFIPLRPANRPLRKHQERMQASPLMRATGSKAQKRRGSERARPRHGAPSAQINPLASAFNLNTSSRDACLPTTGQAGTGTHLTSSNPGLGV